MVHHVVVRWYPKSVRSFLRFCCCMSLLFISVVIPTSQAITSESVTSSSIHLIHLTLQINLIQLHKTRLGRNMKQAIMRVYIQNNHRDVGVSSRRDTCATLRSIALLNNGRLIDVTLMTLNNYVRHDRRRDGPRDLKWAVKKYCTLRETIRKKYSRWVHIYINLNYFIKWMMIK